MTLGSLKRAADASFKIRNSPQWRKRILVLSVVVIGRNEGERLVSMSRIDWPDASAAGPNRSHLCGLGFH